MTIRKRKQKKEIGNIMAGNLAVGILKTTETSFSYPNPFSVYRFSFMTLDTDIYDYTQLYNIFNEPKDSYWDGKYHPDFHDMAIAMAKEYASDNCWMSQWPVLLIDKSFIENGFGTIASLAKEKNDGRGEQPRIPEGTGAYNPFGDKI